MTPAGENRPVFLARSRGEVVRAAVLVVQ